MTYKYIHYEYNGKQVPYTVDLPDDIVFLYDENEIGKMRHVNAHHYLGISRDMSFLNYDNTPLGVTVHKEFPDIVFYDFNNCVIDENIRTITSEDFYKEYELDRYYVCRYFFDTNVYKHRLYSISKILEFKTQYNVKLMNVYVSSGYSWINKDVKSITVDTNNDFLHSIYTYSDDKQQYVVLKDKEELFKDCINKVLSAVNYRLS